MINKEKIISIELLRFISVFSILIVHYQHFKKQKLKIFIKLIMIKSYLKFNSKTFLYLLPL